MSNNTSHSYILQGGKAGSDRLTVLANATWPTSLSFLIEAGLTQGMRCLDIGCGNGVISTKIAQLIGPDGSVHGLDMDRSAIDIANLKAQQLNVQNVSFKALNIEQEVVDNHQKYDFIYLRLLLSHINNPQAVLHKLKRNLSLNGILAIEDVQFDGHFCHPPCAAFDRYVKLYKKAAESRGVNANIGPQLNTTLKDAGFAQVHLNVINPTFNTGDGKLMALLTIQNIKNAVLQAGLISEVDIENIIKELESFTESTQYNDEYSEIFSILGKMHLTIHYS